MYREELFVLQYRFRHRGSLIEILLYCGFPAGGSCSENATMFRIAAEVLLSDYGRACTRSSKRSPGSSNPTDNRNRISRRCRTVSLDAGAEQRRAFSLKEYLTTSDSTGAKKQTACEHLHQPRKNGVGKSPSSNTPFRIYSDEEKSYRRPLAGKNRLPLTAPGWRTRIRLNKH